MRDVVVKAKAKLGKIPDNEFFLNLARENDYNKKIDIIAKKNPSIDQSMDKRTIEKSNFRYIFDELKSIDYFLQGIESNFFNLYFSKYEILFLQEIIEALVNENFTRNYLDFLANPLSKNFILQEDMDLEKFVVSNKESKYYRTLLPFLNKNMQKDNLIFLLSNSLMKYYYRSLIKLGKKFPRNEKDKILNFIGEEINLANFQMIYRLKNFYDIDDYSIFNYLIAGGNKFNGKRLKELSILPIEDLLKFVSAGKYRRIFKNENNIHKEFRKYQYKLYQSEITKEESDILYVISAMNILFISGENIEALIEMDDSFSIDERLEYLIVR